MTTIQNKNPRRKYALVAGIALLLMGIMAGFSFGYVHGTLIVDNDASTTVSNLKSSGFLFRAGILGWLIILLLDVIAAWALYFFLEKIDHSLSLLTAWLRMTYAAILGAGLIHFVSILNLIGGNVKLNPEMTGQHVMLHLHSFEGAWSMGLIIFGFHLLGLGYLAIKSTDVPRIFGILLVIAAFSYLFIHCSKLLHIDFWHSLDTIEMVLSVPMTISELAFAIWLIARGGKSKNENT